MVIKLPQGVRKLNKNIFCKAHLKDVQVCFVSSKIQIKQMLVIFCCFFFELGLDFASTALNKSSGEARNG